MSYLNNLTVIASDRSRMSQVAKPLLQKYLAGMPLDRRSSSNTSLFKPINFLVFISKDTEERILFSRADYQNWKYHVSLEIVKILLSGSPMLFCFVIGFHPAPDFWPARMGEQSSILADVLSKEGQFPLVWFSGEVDGEHNSRSVSGVSLLGLFVGVSCWVCFSHFLSPSSSERLLVYFDLFSLL